MPASERFDAQYYRRFYGRNGVHDRRSIARLANGVLSMAAWWRIPVRTMLDVGAGKGFWRDALQSQHPSVRYHGIDVSAHACRTYGHEHADLREWSPPHRYDLVVCQSVIQYLDDRDAARAVATLGEACRGVLFLEVPTIEDREGALDESGTDLDVHWRSARWYRRQLDRAFVEIGGGLWLSRDCPVVFLALEKAR